MASHTGTSAIMGSAEMAEESQLPTPKAAPEQAEQTSLETSATSSPDTAEPAFAKFMELPEALQFEISKHLDYRTCMYLQSACRVLRNVINPRLISPDKIREFFIKVDSFKQHTDKLVCFTCFQLKSPGTFALQQRRRSHSKKSWCNRKEPGTRYCLDCAAKRKLYGHLEPVRVHRGTRKGDVRFLCHQCGHWGTRGRRCLKQLEKLPDPVVPSILVEQEVTYCLPSDTSDGNPLFVGSKPELALLPLNVQKNIFKHLNYKSLLNLKQTSHWFRENVDPSIASISDKFSFTLAQETAIHSRNNLHIACFACFRVLHERFFNKEQKLLAEQKPHKSWKRRCETCLYRMYGASNPDKEGQVREQELWRKRRFCPRSQTLFYIHLLCEGCAILGPVPGESDDGQDLSKLVPILHDIRRKKSILPRPLILPAPKEPPPPPAPPVIESNEERHQRWERDREERTRKERERATHQERRDLQRQEFEVLCFELGIFCSPDGDLKLRNGFVSPKDNALRTRLIHRRGHLLPYAPYLSTVYNQVGLDARPVQEDKRSAVAWLFKSAGDDETEADEHDVRYCVSEFTEPASAKPTVPSYAKPTVASTAKSSRSSWVTRLSSDPPWARNISQLLFAIPLRRARMRRGQG